MREPDAKIDLDYGSIEQCIQLALDAEPDTAARALCQLSDLLDVLKSFDAMQAGIVEHLELHDNTLREMTE